MKNSAPQWRGRPIRTVKQQRTKNQNATDAAHTINRRRDLQKPIDLILVQNATGFGVWNHPDWPRLRRTCVEMNPEGNLTLKERGRRAYMYDAVLLAVLVVACR